MADVAKKILKLKAREFQCPRWCTKDFDGCAWCRRPRSFDNTVPFEVEQGYDKLRFRGLRHTECNSCCGLLRKHYPLEVAGEAKARKKKIVHEDEAKYEEWCLEVDKYEVELSKTLSKQRVKKGKGKDAPEVAVAEARVHGEHGVSLECRELLGILWPKELYEAEIKRKARQAEVWKAVIGGVAVSGILRAAEFGKPMGAKEIYKNSYSLVGKDTTIANTEGVDRQEELDEHFQAGTNSMNTKVKVVEKEGEEPTLQIKLGKKKDADEFDLVWDAPVVMGGDDDDDAAAAPKEGPTKKKSRTSIPNKQIKAVAEPSASPAQNKRARDIGSTEKIVLEVEQLIRLLGDPTTCKSVTVKATEALEKKLADRLVPAMLPIYAGDYDGVSDIQSMQPCLDKTGMQTLERAQEGQRHLGCAKGLVQALAATDGPLSEASALEDAARMCVAAGLRLPDMKEMVLTRFLTNAVKADKFDDIARCLQASPEARHNVSCLEGARRVAFVEWSAMKCIADLLRFDGKCEAVRLLLASLGAGKAQQMQEMLGCADVQSALWLDIQRLHSIADPMRDGLSDEELKNDRKELESNKQGKLYRALHHFPTGQVLLEGATKAILKRASDAGYIADIHAANAQFAAAELDKGVEVTVKGYEVTIKKVEHYEKAFELYTKVLRNASERFKATHKDALADVKTKVQRLQKAVGEKVSGESIAALKFVFSTVVKQFGSSAQLNTRLRNVEKAVESFNTVTVDPKSWAQGLFLNEDVEALATEYTEFKKFVSTTSIVFPSLAKQSWTVGSEDDNLIALHGMLDAPMASSIQEAAEFGLFKTACKEKLWKLVSDGLSKSIDCMSVRLLIERLLGAGNEFDVTALATCAEAASWKNVASLVSLGRSCASNYAAWIGQTLKVKIDDAPKPLCDISFGLLCAVPSVVSLLKEMNLVLKLPDDLTITKALQAASANEESTIDKVSKELNGLVGCLAAFVGTEVMEAAPGAAPDTKAPTLQRLVWALRQVLVIKTQRRAKALVQDYRLLVDEKLDVCAEENQAVKALLDINDADFTTTTVSKHLAKAQSPAARDFYTLYKAVNSADAASSCFEPYLRRNMLDEVTTESISKCTVKGSDIQKAVALMTTIQALARPLRPDETRGAVVTACVAMLKKQPIGEKTAMLDLLPSSLRSLCTAACATGSGGAKPT